MIERQVNVGIVILIIYTYIIYVARSQFILAKVRNKNLVVIFSVTVFVLLVIPKCRTVFRQDCVVFKTDNNFTQTQHFPRHLPPHRLQHDHIAASC